MSDWIKYVSHHKGRTGLGVAIVVCTNGKQKNSARLTREAIRALRHGLTAEVGSVKVELYYREGEVAIKASPDGEYLVSSSGNCAALSKVIAKAGGVEFPLGTVIPCVVEDWMLVADLSKAKRPL